MPFFWVDWPALGTPGLGAYLRGSRAALTAVTVPVMARPLQGLPPAHLPGEVDLVRVQGESVQAGWLEVFMTGFDEPEASRPDFRQFPAGTLAGPPRTAEPQPLWEHYLARWQEEPCATATLLRTTAGVAGIYHVATLPAYRGRGLGRALTLAAMQAAGEAGDETAILLATPSGYPVYGRLGFETVTTVDLYAWDGSAWRNIRPE